MPVLANFVLARPANYAMFRQYFTHFAIGWWDMDLIQSGQETIVEEHPFGGYRLVTRFSDNLWDFGSGTWRGVDNLFTDFYALAPGDSTPISPGDVIYNPQFDTATGLFILTFALSPSDGHYWVQQLPQQPPDFWLPQPANNPSSPFYIG